MDDFKIAVWIVFGIIFGGFLSWAITFGYSTNQIDVLGTAICHETKGTEFVEYSNGIVQCQKDNPQMMDYDGIKIKDYNPVFNNNLAK